MSIFVRVSGKNRYFCKVSQQVLSEVVAKKYEHDYPAEKFALSLIFVELCISRISL